MCPPPLPPLPPLPPPPPLAHAQQPCSRALKRLNRRVIMVSLATCSLVSDYVGIRSRAGCATFASGPHCAPSSGPLRHPNSQEKTFNACNTINTVQMAPECRELTITKAGMVLPLGGMHMDRTLSPAPWTSGNCSIPLAPAAKTTPYGTTTATGEQSSTFCAV